MVDKNMNSMECIEMAMKWNDPKHKPSPEIRAQIKREAKAELQHIRLTKPAKKRHAQKSHPNPT